MSSRLNQYIHFAPLDDVNSDVSNSESSYANSNVTPSLLKANFIFGTKQIYNRGGLLMHVV